MFENLLSMDTFIQPVLAGFIGGGLNYVYESNPAYQNNKAYLKYAGIVAGSNLLGKVATDAIIPHFNNPLLWNIQKLAMSAGTTSFFNTIGQREFSDDARMENVYYGALAGAGSTVLTTFVTPMLHKSD